MRRAFLQPPFDLLYGFRGQSHRVDLLSPYEMLMHWSMEEVRPPSAHDMQQRAAFTDAGKAYALHCKSAGITPTCTAGTHYIAVPGEKRILLPDIEVLGTLRHRWVWEMRPRPHVPLWSVTKIPKSNISPEENARMLSVYMRPWTLYPPEHNEHVPLLTKMREILLTSSAGDGSTHASTFSDYSGKDVALQAKVRQKW